MYTNCTFGTWVPGRYIAVGLYSGVAVKRDSTVYHLSTVVTYTMYHITIFNHLHRLSSRILTELLSTYSSTDASEADPALVERLVVLVISDSTQFVFDHLIALPALTALKTHNIYKVCTSYIANCYPYVATMCMREATSL